MKKKMRGPKTTVKKVVGKKPARKSRMSKKIVAKKQPPRLSGTFKAEVSAKKLAKKIAKKFKTPPVKKIKYLRSEPQAGGMPEQTLKAALLVLDERQADDIVTVNVTGKSSVADYLVVASGRAQRQLSALAHYLREAFAKLGVHKVRVEGLPAANWVLVDAGDVIVHLFRPEVRRYYDIENIWRDGPDHSDS